MNEPARWLHRLAVLMVCLVWPLIWVGGLVTTYDAGMAVPDWPGTYGYNMFLYPLETWLYGPFDLLVEHGHRLLGALVGMVAIAAAIAAWMTEPRSWVVVLAQVCLVAVVAQGALGGARVVLDERTLAMIHGCFGPAFFAMCTGLAVVTSRWWWQTGPTATGSQDGAGIAGLRVGRGKVILAAVLALLCYAQLILGAQLRHLHPTTSPVGFRHLVEAHVGTAIFVWVLSIVLAIALWKCGDLALSRPARWLVPLVLLQIGLGLATWLVNYGLPIHTDRLSSAWSGNYVIISKGFVESGIVTAHVATGSLLIACSVMVWLRSGRVARLAIGSR